MTGPRAALLLALAIAPAGAQNPRLAVTSVRFWSMGGSTRIAIETNGGFEYRSDKLEDPGRIFFDMQGARNGLVSKGMHVIPVGDGLIRQIRVAEMSLSVTRVVLDLETEVTFAVSTLRSPDRLMIEVKSMGDTPVISGEPARSGARMLEPAAVEPAKPPEPRPQHIAAARAFSPPPARPAARKHGMLIASAPPVVASAPGTPRRTLMSRVMSTLEWPPAPADPAPERVTAAPPAAPRAETAKPAQRNSSGQNSMTRALGLKIRRVVIDPGHGGHDFGTTGPGGMHEKDLVLDTAKRLAALVEEKMGSEVVLTRDDDTYVALEQRPHIANDRKADLFISIHANSSPIRSVIGVETFYLSFTTSKSALEVAARENASSDRSVFELKDLLQKIALFDKVDESRELAGKVQSSLFGLSSKAVTGSRNRGVKRAPFVVLIGASMPSVLAEIGFISNAKEETLLKKPEHRQKIAEALVKGIQQYASTLSHFQVAQRED